MAIIQTYPVTHIDEEQAKHLGRGLVIGDHFSIGQDEQGQPMQIYGLLVVWENQTNPCQTFVEPQYLINELDFDSIESVFEEDETEESEAENQILPIALTEDEGNSISKTENPID